MKYQAVLAATVIAFAGAVAQTSLAAEAQRGRTPLTQPQCNVCIVGTPVVQWSDASGRIHVDGVQNKANFATGDLMLSVSLEPTYPTFLVPTQFRGPDDVEYTFSESVALGTLSPGGSRSTVDSGPIAFGRYPIPAGEYWLVVHLWTELAGGWAWRYEDYAVLRNKVSCDGSKCSVLGTSPPFAQSVARLLPIVIDVSNGSAHYTTEMTLTNNTLHTVWLSMLYTASLGSKQGSGTVTDSLAPGEQRMVADVLSYLRVKGLAIPSSEEQPSQGGTLVVTFEGNDSVDPRLVAVTARTAALTSAPHPIGRAGLAYSGLLDTDSSTSSLTLFGLRSTSTDRTNVAVFNTSGDPVTLKVMVHSGSGDGRSVVFREAETLPPYGWLQYGSAQILDGNGITNGWVTVERISTTGSFSAYAVINDSKTHDGSYVPPVRGAVAGTTLSVPVLPEEPDFRSELILVNKSASNATLDLNWVEDHGWFPLEQTMAIKLGPHEERIIPNVIDFLRTNGFRDTDETYVPYIGAVQLVVSGTSAEDVFAGTRTVSQSPAGGQFGLFAPCLHSGQEASSEAYIYGLRADAENRWNVAVGNTGTYSDGTILAQLQAYDGDGGGAPKGDPLTVQIGPREMFQLGWHFRNSGVANGWVKVTRMSGTAPWFAYGVVYDGGKPGERTGDGAYVPMVK